RQPRHGSKGSSKRCLTPFFSEKVSDTIFSLLVEQAPAKLGAQLLAADLADGCRPEAVDEHDLIRHLELGETALADPRLQRGRFRLLAARDHERAAALAEVRIRHRDDRRIEHARMREQVILDLL